MSRTEERRPGGEAEAATGDQESAGSSASTVAPAARTTPPVYLQQRRTLGELLEELSYDTRVERDVVESAESIIDRATQRRARSEQNVLDFLAGEHEADRFDEKALIRAYETLRDHGGRGLARRWREAGLPHLRTMQARARRAEAS